MIHKTYLMMLIEEEQRMNISAYLRGKMRAGWTLQVIADDLGISVSTASKWTRMLGYSRIQAAERAWEHDLIPQVDMGAAKPRRAPVRRIM